MSEFFRQAIPCGYLFASVIFGLFYGVGGPWRGMFLIGRSAHCFAALYLVQSAGVTPSGWQPGRVKRVLRCFLFCAGSGSCVFIWCW
ncbi:metabolite transport protein [Salmonella bongori]|nr:metabolite transport protein [Salmonella bongori]